MQLIISVVGHRHLVLNVDENDTSHVIGETVEKLFGLPTKHQILRYAGKQIPWNEVLYDVIDRFGGCTVHVDLLVAGGAAAKERALKEKREREQEATKERNSWLDLADKTQETGVMRLLIESQVLNKHKMKVHGIRKSWYIVDPKEPLSEEQKESFSSDPNADPKIGKYDDPCGEGNGYPRQAEYNKTVAAIADKFFKVWEQMTEEHKVGLKSLLLPANDKASEVQTEGGRENLPIGKNFPSKDNKDIFTLIEGKGFDALWYNGPKQILKNGQEVWSVKADATDAKVWHLNPDGTGRFKPPWLIDPENPDSDLERWIFEGIGTVTYFVNEKPGKQTPQAPEPGTKSSEVATQGKSGGTELVLWTEQTELDTCLGGLTDREKLRLKQKWQLVQKHLNKKDLSSEEKDLEKNLIPLLVEEGPMHRPNKGIHQWRIKPLRRQLADKCVFWQNMETDIPGGSNAGVNLDKVKLGNCKDSGYDTPDPPKVWDECPNESEFKERLSKVVRGEGNEAFRIWKYGQLIGTLKKYHVREDRQRFLDTIEMYTPTYRAVIKNQGRPADENGHNSHYMQPKLLREITDIVALAMDMNLPDHREDRVACFIKTLMDERLGPGTWHVLVGRSFGFSVQSEAKHFVHLHMQHLAIVIWKYEPDPAPTEGRIPVPEQQGQNDTGGTQAARDTPADASKAGGSAASAAGKS